MKKKFLLSASIAMLFGTTSAFALQSKIGNSLGNKKVESVKKLSKEELKKINQEISGLNKRVLELKAIDGVKTHNVDILKIKLYYKGVPRQDFVAYKPENSTLLIFGKAVDYKTGKEVSMPKDMKSVKEGVAFKIGHGPKVLYLVTDPECPFCKRMEKNIRDDLKDKYTINVIPMPLSFHRHAKQMYYYIFSGKTDAEKAKRMEEVMKGKDNNWQNFKPTSEQKAKFDKIIEKGYKAAKELGARGTPSVFDEKGNPVNYMKLMKFPAK
jgi:thiol:disulfide interchange protein DsbC